MRSTSETLFSCGVMKMIMNVTQLTLQSWKYLKNISKAHRDNHYTLVLKLINILWIECFSFNILMVLILDFIDTLCLCYSHNSLVCFCGIIVWSVCFRGFVWTVRACACGPEAALMMIQWSSVRVSDDQYVIWTDTLMFQLVCWSGNSCVFVFKVYCQHIKGQNRWCSRTLVFLC